MNSLNITSSFTAYKTQAYKRLRKKTYKNALCLKYLSNIIKTFDNVVQGKTSNISLFFPRSSMNFDNATEVWVNSLSAVAVFCPALFLGILNSVRDSSRDFVVKNRQFRHAKVSSIDEDYVECTSLPVAIFFKCTNESRDKKAPIIKQQSKTLSDFFKMPMAKPATNVTGMFGIYSLFRKLAFRRSRLFVYF